MRTHVIVLVVAILASAAISHASYQDDVVALVNDLRLSNGLNTLTVSPELNLAAQTYTEYLLTTGQLTHFPSDGSSPTSRAIKAGYHGVGEISELLTAAVTTPQQAFTVWSMSPSHKMGMLTAYFKEIGVGYAYDPAYLRDAKHNYGRVWVIMLGCGPDPATLAQPVIESVIPTSGPVGTRVKIYGKDFGSRCEAWFNGLKARTAYQSNTMLLVYVPTGATTGEVSVHNLVSDKATVGPVFTVSAAAGPVMSSISPDTAAVGETVTITGTRFGTTRGQVKFTGATVPSTYWSDRQIRVEVPQGAVTGAVSVITAGGAESNSVQLTVLSDEPLPPSIAALQPAAFKPGQAVKIQGANFGQSGQVVFDGLLAEAISWYDNLITAVVPAGVADGYLVVTNGDGLQSNPMPFTIVTAIINGIAPATGSPGTEVTISGSGFGVGGSVAFAGAEAEVTSWSDTSIKAKVPANAHSGRVTVRTEDGQVIEGPEFVVESGDEQALVFNGTASSSKSPVCHSVPINSNGNMEATLSWTGAASLDVRLYVRSGNRWKFVAKSVPDGGGQALRLNVVAGSYLFQVCSQSGTADYTLTVRLP